MPGLSEELQQTSEGGQKEPMLSGAQQPAVVVPQIHRCINHQPILTQLRPKLRPSQETASGVSR